MKRLLIILSTTVCTFYLSACSSAESQSQTAPAKVSLSDSAETHILVDDLALLGDIGDILFVDDNRFIISDRKPSVSLFKNFKMVATFGAEGKGPCEFTNISAIDVENDTLYVLNSNQSKIIKFDVNTQKCLGEISHKALSTSYYLHFREKNHSFLLGRTSYLAPTPDSTVVMQILDSKGDIRPLDLTLDRINPVDAFVQLRAPGMNFSVSGQTLFAYFPLTDSLYALNLNNLQFQAFPLRINTQREEMESAVSNIDKVLEIIQGNEFQFVTRIASSPDWIAIRTQQQASRKGKKPITHLQFYTHDGKFIGKLSTANETIAFHDDKLVEIRQSTDPDAEYTYSIEFREVILN